MLTRHATLLRKCIHFSPDAKPRSIISRPWRIVSRSYTREMKRKATESVTEPKAKRQKEPELDYCDVIPRKDDHGNILWPASKQSIDCARDFLKEW